MPEKRSCRAVTEPIKQLSEPLVSTQTANEQLRRADAQRWAAAVRGLQPYAARLRELAGGRRA